MGDNYFIHYITYMNIKTPLTIMSVFFGLSFMDGAFGWGLSDGFYTMAGLSYAVALGWMWVIVYKQ